MNTKTLALSMICLVASACAPVGAPEAEQIIDSDYKTIYVSDIPSNLTLEEAISFALENNLDAKIAEQNYIASLKDVGLQKLNALPTLTARRQFLKRNNEPASSSISAETGVQSLEPSISSDRSQRTEVLEANWELMDSIINIYRARSTTDQSKIAEERYSKVLHNIMLDTYSAYYKLASFQKSEENIDGLYKKSRNYLDILDKTKNAGDVPYEKIEALKKQIFEQRGQLAEIKRLRQLAALELNALMSVSPDANIKLDYDFSSTQFAKNMSDIDSIETYIDKALNNRPEIQEEFINFKISKRNVNLEILETFPGLGVLVTANNDDSSFLENSSWFNITTTLSQSITRILTLPARYKRAEQAVEAADAKKRALVAAVVFQVNIAYMGLKDTYQKFLEQKSIFQISESKIHRENVMKDAGLMSGLEHYLAQTQFELDRAFLYQNQVNSLIALERLNQSAGYGSEIQGQLPAQNKKVGSYAYD